MQTSGLIFDSSSSRRSGTIRPVLPRQSRAGIARYHVRRVRRPVAGPLRVLSAAALLVGMAVAILTFLPVAAMELKYRLDRLSMNHEPRTMNNLPILSGFNLDPLPMPEPNPENAEEAFSIAIPKIGAKSVVLFNVDAGDPKVYMPALRKGVAHALGTGLPGVKSDVNRTIYLFAHSTSAPALVARYNAQFYLLYKLAVGDDIDVTFWTKPFRYRVVETKIVPPEDTTFLQPQTEKELLVLATCWPPGTTKERLLVIAEPVGNMPAP